MLNKKSNLEQKLIRTVRFIKKKISPVLLATTLALTPVYGCSKENSVKQKTPKEIFYKSLADDKEEVKYNLEVVFFDVDSCYVAEKCKGKVCDSIKDYRPNKRIELFSFKPNTLKILGPSQAITEGYDGPNRQKHCVSTSFDSKQVNELESYLYEVSNFIYSWTNGSMKIIPHFRFTKAEFSSDGILNKEVSSLTGFTGSQGPSPDEIKYYAKKAGVDVNNMDMFIATVNNYPKEGSKNDGLLVQQCLAGMGGEFHGVGIITMTGMEWRMNQENNNLDYYPLHRDLFIPLSIHELTHVVNVGHYSISKLKDVYGIENAESRGWKPKKPWPHCTAKNHYTKGKPDRYKYFPDSYYWLDPMWNSKPFEPYPKSGAVSYCLKGQEFYPKVNPLNPEDHYEDIKGLGENMKYYKFIYQAHYSPNFVGKFHTNSYKAGLKKYPLR